MCSSSVVSQAAIVANAFAGQFERSFAINYSAVYDGKLGYKEENQGKLRRRRRNKQENFTFFLQKA
jgi:hypothetical protein